MSFILYTFLNFINQVCVTDFAETYSCFASALQWKLIPCSCIIAHKGSMYGGKAVGQGQNLVEHRTLLVCIEKSSMTFTNLFAR